MWLGIIIRRFVVLWCVGVDKRRDRLPQGGGHVVCLVLHLTRIVCIQKKFFFSLRVFVE